MSTPGDVGIVGESGCGKSVTCYALMGLIQRPPGRIERGEALFEGWTCCAAASSGSKPCEAAVSR
jgi:ABC-type dipeptide/oligopeptide/nickel transport system ATPase component